MLIGAAVGATAGGAGAAIQGGDPMKGALMGGAMGAVGGGLGGATAAAPAAGIEGAASGAAAGGAGSAVTPTATALAGSGSGAGMGTIGAASNVGAGISGVGAGSGTLGSAGFGTMSAAPSSGIGISAGAGGAAPGAGISAGTAGGTGGLGSGLSVAQGSALPAGGYSATGSMPATTNVFGQAAGTPGYLSNTQLGMTAGTAGLAGAMQAERANLGTPATEEYEGPLSKLKYDPDKFTASAPQYAPKSVYRPTYAAEGGIMQAYRGGNIGAVADYDDEPGMDNFRSGGIARYDAGGMALGMPGGIPSGGGYQNTPDSLAPQGLEALMGNRKRMLTKEQMDAIKMQGMSKGALKDVYGQMASQGLAKGGPAGNKDMIAIDNYIAAAQGGDMASVMAKAQAGDYNAMLALNKVRKTPNQNYAAGGHLGGYSDGGRMLKGPGDGMSDNIPATIAGKQPARLADGEFVVPADVVSHLGNGSTDAGAKQLYSMMDRVRKARTGNKKQGKQIKPTKYMVA
jgi:hypothetical protein